MAFLPALKEMLPYLVSADSPSMLFPVSRKTPAYYIIHLLIVLPVLCLAAGFLYGFFTGFHQVLPLLIAVLFLPTMYLYYNPSALAYAFTFLFITFVGNGVGCLI